MQTSCGYGVPWLNDDPGALEANESDDEETPKARLEDRKTLGHWAAGTVEKDAMVAYRAKNNARSLDDTGGLKAARRTRGEVLWLEDFKLYLRRLAQQWDTLLIGMLLAFAIVLAGGGLPLLKSSVLSFAGLR